MNRKVRRFWRAEPGVNISRHFIFCCQVNCKVHCQVSKAKIEVFLWHSFTQSSHFQLSISAVHLFIGHFEKMATMATVGLRQIVRASQVVSSRGISVSAVVNKKDWSMYFLFCVNTGWLCSFGNWLWSFYCHLETNFISKFLCNQ